MGNLADGFVLTDKDSRVVYMNKSAEDIFEFHFQPDNPVFFKQIGRLMNLETQESFFCPVSRAIQEDKTVGLSKNIGLMHQDEPVFLSATCSPRHNKKGEVIGCSAVFRDISMLRGIAHKVESDQYYMRSVFEAAKIGICSLNTRGEIVEVNESALEILGGTYQEVIGRQFGDVFQCVNCVPHGCGKGDKCKFCIIRNNIEAAVLDDSFSSEYVAAVITKASEEPVWLQFFLTQVWKENEKQIVLTMIDISRRKQREKELMEARRMAEAANNTKTQFLANMSHEIRTPLNAIVGFSELQCMDDYSNEDKMEFEKIIKENSALLLNLINDILDISRIESGRVTIDYRPCDLVKLCHSCLISMKQARPLEHVEYQEQYPVDSLYIKTDVVKFKQVIINLLTNASKFTKEGHIRLSFSVDDGNRFVTVAISDTGIGVPKEKAEMVFERFVKLNQYAQGTGLGLSLCRIIVERLGGKIWLDTSYTEGARFMFSIPLTIAQKEEMAEDQG